MSNLDYQLCRETLQAALDAARSGDSPTHPMAKDIRWLLLESTHKTYRYILVNALLGRACANVNPLALQAGSNLADAWDARSLCHKVLVPFEQSNLDSRMGGSNEPFLNKPARFKEVSKENAVRRGQDEAALQLLYSILSSVGSAEESMLLLTIAMSAILERDPLTLEVIDASDQGSRSRICDLLSDLLEHNIEGEALTVATGVCFAHLGVGGKYKMQFHPVNQSGASSNEVCDIDILDTELDCVVYGIEVKDKEFSETDVLHAVRKCKEGGVGSLSFITRAKYLKTAVPSGWTEPDGFDVMFMTAELLQDTVSLLGGLIGMQDVHRVLEQFISEARPKDETLSLLRSFFDEE